MVKLKYYNLTLIPKQAVTEEKDEVAKNNFIVLWRRYYYLFIYISINPYQIGMLDMEHVNKIHIHMINRTQYN